MIRLHYSNRLENLIAPLAAAIAEQQHREPLDAVTIVVPNRVVEQFVRYRVAEAIGIAANLRFRFLHKYLAQIAQATDAELKILEADELQLLLFECLRRREYRDDLKLKAARDYLEAGSATAADVELRTMLLSGQLARLFREYSISRRPMIRKWWTASRAEADAMSETERWQRHLWQLIFDSHGRVEEQWLEARGRRLMMLPDAFERADQTKLRAAWQESIHVFGYSYAGSAYAEIFARLGALGEIQIYALNPCREFWEDVDTSRRRAPNGWARRQDRVGAKLAEAEDPFGLNEAGDTPALRLWGRPGREYIRLLNELSQCDFAPLFSDAGASEAATVLETLQRNILEREAQPTPVEDGEGRAGEARIKFLACPGIRREVEIVANEIWSMVRDNEKLAAAGAAERIRFHEIGVLIPDGSVDDYAAHIESVFRNQHRIPIDLVSRTSAGASRVAEAVELLLQLPSGRFTRAEMIRLLTHPALKHDSEAGVETEVWQRWSEALGIFFGADDDDLKESYIPRGLYHWDQAIKRLALGTMMTSRRGGGDGFYEADGGGSIYLPFEVEQDELEPAARFVRVARSLIADASAMREARLTPREWSRMLIALINAYIGGASAADEKVRDGFLEAIESIGESAIEVGAMGYEAARELMAARVAELESRRGQYSGRGVAVGSFSSLRSIPFKAIFAVGLNDGVFPEREHREPLDLRSMRRVAGDVSATERARYMFLETILSAREQICFSYIAREPKTGEGLEPSPAIRELQFLLRGYLEQAALEKLTVTHPVSRYDLKYFPELDAGGASEGAGEYASFDAAARRGTRMIALRKKIGPLIQGADNCGEIVSRLAPALRARLESELQFARFDGVGERQAEAEAGEIALPLAALRRYLECPLQGAARHALGIREDDEGEDESDDEPLGQSRLERTMMLREVFWRARGNRESFDDEYQRAVRREQYRGHAAAGQFAEAAADDDKAALCGWSEEAAAAGVSELEGWREIRIGRADEFAEPAEIFPAIALEVDIRRNDGSVMKRRVGLYGTIRGIAPEHGASVQCVLRKSCKPKDFLPAFLNAVALAAAGAEMPKAFRAIVLRENPDKKSEPVRELETMDREAARGYLSEMVGDLLSAGNDYFLPIEAVEEIVKEIDSKKTRDPVDTVEQIILNDGRACSSDYGPVRNPRDFDPPEEEEIERIVERRFGPIKGIFK